MCGIAGFLQRDGLNPEHAHRVLVSMTQAVRHRGPDDAGSWVDADAGIALGHRRLSILDLSPLGHQPMHSASGRYVVSFNGEIYNFRELRKELSKVGHAFRGHSDTEVFLAAVSQWGVHEALQRFNGMFAFALWDRLQRALHLARDRAGEKPLYYGWLPGLLLFGSELKALRAHPRWQGEVDRDALALFLRFGCVPAPHTIYQGVRKLPPATVLTFANGSADAKPIPYWSPRDIAERGCRDRFTGSVPDAVAQLDALLRDAVRLRMEADVPLGAFLSGGIDSSTVVALMQAQSTRPVKTFTIGFPDASYNEAKRAAAVARHLGTEHTELYVTPYEAQAVIPRLGTMYDEPFADPSQIPTFLIAELTRRYVTVSLSGDAGDELFGGYRRYRRGRALWTWLARLPVSLRRTAARVLMPHPVIQDDGALLQMLNPLARRWTGKRNLTERLRQAAELLAAESPAAVYRYLTSYCKAPETVLKGHPPCPAAATDPRWAHLPDLFHEMMFCDLVTYLPDDILVKVDRASMAVSLEARIPLLDHRVIDFAWHLPPSLKLRDGASKWLLRQVLYRYVPEPLVARPKQGFDAPISAWLRGPLRDWAEGLIAERRLRADGFFDLRPIRQRWSDHVSGRTNWEFDLWAVLMFQAWRDADRQSANSARLPAVEANGVPTVS